MPRFMKIFIGGIIFIYLAGMGALWWSISVSNARQEKREEKLRIEKDYRLRCAAQRHRLKLVQQNTRLKSELPQAHLDLERAAVRGIVITCSRVVKQDLDGLSEAEERDRSDTEGP